MGKKIKRTLDISLASAHELGTQVKVIQPSLHNVYGVINIPWPRYLAIHLNGVKTHIEQIKALHLRVLELPVDRNNARSIPEPLVCEMYSSSMQLVTNMVLAFEHITLEIERAANLFLSEDKKLNERLISVSQIIKFDAIPSSEAYSKFCELQDIRNAIMHPSAKTIYNYQNWDKCPLAWFFSNKCIECYDASFQLLLRFYEKWEPTRQIKSIITLTVERGIKYSHPFKKPPKKDN